MITGFDRILIDVPDLQAASADYSVLLGEFQAAPGICLLPLANVAIELREAPIIENARIAGLSLVDDDLPDAAQGTPLPPPNRDLYLLRANEPCARLRGPATQLGISAVDHVVLQTASADGCIELFREGGLGMRLALDQDVPQWGGRMLFSRTGKLTLEVIHNREQPPESDFFANVPATA